MSKRRIEQVKRQYQDQVLAIEGVVGVGIGEMTHVSGTRSPCIRIYVEKLDEKLARALPTQLEGYPTEIKEVGRPRLLSRRLP